MRRFSILSKIARKVMSGVSLGRGILEIWLESERRELKKEASKVLIGERLGVSDLGVELDLLRSASSKEEKRKTILELLESYIEIQRTYDEVQSFLKGLKLRLKVMVTALSFTLGCISPILRSLTSLFSKTHFSEIDFILFSLPCLIATYYSAYLVGESKIKWILWSLVVFTFSFLFSLTILPKIPIVGT